MFVDLQIEKLGGNVRHDRLGGIVYFTARVQVHLGLYGKVKASEASAGIAEAYIDEITSTGLENQGWLDGLDAVIVVFAHTIGVAIVLFEEVAGVGSGSGVIRVSSFLSPG